MIKTTKMLTAELKEYVNTTTKIRQLIKNKEVFPIVRGLFETDAHIPGHYLAPIIYGPSYLSFEFALAFYDLIPEAVYSYTSATFEKRRSKQYNTPFGRFTYQDVASDAYPVGIVRHVENGYSFQIASPEKALCDELYIKPPLGNRAELEQLLYEDLRIEPDDFALLNRNDLLAISAHYHTRNHKLLQVYVKRMIKNG
ncbi:MAG: hypothetical protein PHC86_03785 [Eubacteriales bacterium]|nr:hypothetical protein [Eubacteriales bacterium]